MRGVCSPRWRNLAQWRWIRSTGAGSADTRRGSELNDPNRQPRPTHGPRVREDILNISAQNDILDLLMSRDWRHWRRSPILVWRYLIHRGARTREEILNSSPYDDNIDLLRDSELFAVWRQPRHGEVPRQHRHGLDVDRMCDRFQNVVAVSTTRFGSEVSILRYQPRPTHEPRDEVLKSTIPIANLDLLMGRESGRGSELYE